MARYDDWWDGPPRGREDEVQEWVGDGPRGRDGVSGRIGSEDWPGGGWHARPVYGPERYGLGPYHERLRRRRRADDEVEREVKDALFYDTWVDADAITVEVRDGIVTLRGALPSYEEVRYASDDAWDVDGVVGVQSELEVKE